MTHATDIYTANARAARDAFFVAREAFFVAREAADVAALLSALHDEDLAGNDALAARDRAIEAGTPSDVAQAALDTAYEKACAGSQATRDAWDARYLPSDSLTSGNPPQTFQSPSLGRGPLLVRAKGRGRVCAPPQGGSEVAGGRFCPGRRASLPERLSEPSHAQPPKIRNLTPRKPYRPFRSGDLPRRGGPR
jgi:hypothetical protein